MRKDNSLPRFWALIPAAGSGSRMGLDQPKQYLPLGHQCVIEWSIVCFLEQADLLGVFVALAADDAEFSRLSVASDPRVHRCVGGAERAHSVLAGLNALLQAGADEHDWVMVHDAARPGLNASAISRLRTAAHCSSSNGESQADGAILALPVADTLKRAAGGKAPRIAETIERTNLWQAQTPQYFPLQMLHSALSQALSAGVAITDEASAIEHMGGHPALVMGDARNFKITWPGDLALAEQLLIPQLADASGRTSTSSGNHTA